MFNFFKKMGGVMVNDIIALIVVIISLVIVENVIVGVIRGMLWDVVRTNYVHAVSGVVVIVIDI